MPARAGSAAVRRWAGEALPSLSVYKPVDGLCRTGPILCVSRKKLGIPAVSLAHDKSSAWMNAIHTLCIGKKLELSTCHAEISLERTKNLS